MPTQKRVPRFTVKYLYDVTSKHDNPDSAAAAFVNIVNTCIESIEAERDALAVELETWRARAESAEYRLEHPKLAENQDDLARICYEAYIGYISPDGAEPWEDVDAWESYAWRLASNAVRVATAAELAAVKAESLRVVPVGEAISLYDLSPCGAIFGLENHLYYGFHDGRYDQYICLTDGEDLPEYSREFPIVQPVRLEPWEAGE
jgi:hypothetical protein